MAGLTELMGKLNNTLNSFGSKIGGQSASGLSSGQAGPPLSPEMQKQRRSEHFDKLAGAQSSLGMGNSANEMMTFGRAATGDPKAIMEAIKMTGDNFKDKMSQAGGDLKRAATADTLGEAAGGVFRGGQHSVEAMGVGAKYTAPAQLLKFTAAIAESGDKLREWSKGLHNANMQFAEFSGSMATVEANQQVRDIMLSQQRGDRRAATAEYLASGKSEMEGSFSKWDDLFANVKNLVNGAFTRLASTVLAPLDSVADKLNEWLEKMAPEARASMEEDFARGYIDSAEEALAAVREMQRPERMRNG